MLLKRRHFKPLDTSITEHPRFRSECWLSHSGPAPAPSGGCKTPSGGTSENHCRPIERRKATLGQAKQTSDRHNLLFNLTMVLKTTFMGKYVII